MKIRILAVAAAMALASAGAGAQEDVPPCSELVTQVDQMLASQGNDLNEEVLAQIVELRNQGGEQCDNGDEAAATGSLEHAISLFNQ